MVFSYPYGSPFVMRPFSELDSYPVYMEQPRRQSYTPQWGYYDTPRSNLYSQPFDDWSSPFQQPQGSQDYRRPRQQQREVPVMRADDDVRNQRIQAGSGFKSPEISRVMRCAPARQGTGSAFEGPSDCPGGHFNNREENSTRSDKRQIKSRSSPRSDPFKASASRQVKAEDETPNIFNEREIPVICDEEEDRYRWPPERKIVALNTNLAKSTCDQPTSRDTEVSRKPSNDVESKAITADNESEEMEISFDANAQLNQLTAIKTELDSLEARIEAFRGERTDKEFIVIDELLTRALLRLDQIESNGIEDIRRQRKDLVIRTNALADRLEKAGQHSEDVHSELSSIDGEMNKTENCETAKESKAGEPTETLLAELEQTNNCD